MARLRAHWLDELETKVHEAARAVRELREENRGLLERNQELEGRIAELERMGEGGTSRWEEERQEIRDRVEAITRGLEKLLEE